MYYLLLTAVFVITGQAAEQASPNRADRRQPAEQESAEELFSGPQVGEKLSSFTMREALGERAGERRDPVNQAGAEPLVLVFIHDVNRQSISMTRVLTGYTRSRAKDGLHTAVILLDDDPSAAEMTLKRIQHALTAEVPTGVSLDGREGPGKYGLNRHVMLTILVAKAGVVTANFALIQPSLQVDLPKLLTAVVNVVGGPVPKLEDFAELREQMANREMNRSAPDLRALLAPLIRRDATIDQVDQAARIIEQRCAMEPIIRAEVERVASTIVKSGKLENYGTARAQEYLQKWAREKAKDAKPNPATKE